MKTMLSILMVVLIIVSATAQNPEKENTIKPSIDNMEEVMSDFVYPIEARKNGIEGCVKVQFVVDEEGKLIKSRIKSSCNPLLKKAMQEVMDQFEFSPAKMNGKAVAGAVTVPFTFELDVE
jgi:TonB family protein